jgi:hypothetical protein
MKKPTADQTMISTSAEAAENAVLPLVHEVHTDPAKNGCLAQTLPKTITSTAAEKSPARWAYERVILYIQNFETQLDADHEVAMGFAGGDAGVIRIEGLGYFDPDIITFYGTDDDGAKTQLVQHVTQLNVMLMALPKLPEQPEPNRIGFQLAREL